MTPGPAHRRVLIWVGHFEPGFRAGGPIRSVAHIVDRAPDDVEVTVVTRDRDMGVDEPFPGLSGRCAPRGRHGVVYLDTRSARQWWSLARRLRATAFETVYVNSFWSPVFALLPVVAARLGIIRSERVLVAPRGELSSGALSLKSRKKRLALRAWRPWFTHRNVLWHATSDAEVTDITSVFPDADVHLVPGEAALPETALPPPPARHGSLRLVFISRISPKKNLLALIEALATVRGGVELDVYGPIGDAGYWSTCLDRMSALPAHVRVSYRGELPHDRIVATFSAYDAFCLPTLGENFGHVIAESLAASCPVLCTDLTPWTPVLRNGGGTVLASPAAADVADGVQEWADLTPAARHARRLKAGQAYGHWRTTREDVTVLDRIRPTRHDPARRRIALVTQGFRTGGGVPQVARWMRDSLRAIDGYEVDLHDVATARSDPHSRRLLSPRTWPRRSLRQDAPADDATFWGANAVELELMRYRPRRELTMTLNGYDVVQIVCGGPALGRVAAHVTVPVVLETATRVAWERAPQLAGLPWPRRFPRAALTRLVERAELRALAGADAVLAANRELGDELRNRTAVPVIVAAHGIDTGRFRPHPGGLRQQGPLLSVCRLADARKGLERLIEAYGELLRRAPGAPGLVLAGKGSLSRPAREAIHRLGLADRITIKSDIPAEDLPTLYREASVYVQASYEEGFGLSVAEAMASGLPVVCTDTAGTRETVVHGETGWMIPQEPGPVTDRMAEALLAALGPEGRDRGLAGLARCSRLFAADVTIQKITSLYDDLLASRAQLTSA